MWEYRDGYRDQIFLVSANHIIVDYLDCDFVGVRMVCLGKNGLLGTGVE